ncbi:MULTISPECIES: glycosyltransferase family 25 protein [unclassified Cedecea]|uniref:glycosyltransferase family 25 protein n=1 Tax=unclassified Cedecea TaxID=2649846 RepID=UPI0030177277
MTVPVYVVSLLRDDERRNRIKNIFSDLNIDFVFFDAVDAKDPRNKSIIESMRVAGESADMTDGEIACTLSHQFIYKDIVDKSYEWAVILEDDVIVDSRFAKFLSSFNENEYDKLNNNNLYLLGGQKGLHDYPVLGLSHFSKINVSTCTFKRVTFNRGKIRRTCSYLMNKDMARNLLKLTQSYGTYRADSWFLMDEKNIINDFYLDEIIEHPILNGTNSHLESERALVAEKKRPRSYIQKKMKVTRSWIKVFFFSFFK